MRYRNNNVELPEPYTPPISKYLYVKCLTNGSFSLASSLPSNLEMSTNGVEWVSKNKAETINFSAGQIYLFKGQQPINTFWRTSTAVGTIIINSGEVEIGGDLWSLYNWPNERNGLFESMFRGANKNAIIYADKLILQPTTYSGKIGSRISGVYTNLFSVNNGSLKKAPTIGEGIYNNLSFSAMMWGAPDNCEITTYATGIINDSTATTKNWFVQFIDGAPNNLVLHNLGTLDNTYYSHSN